MSRPIQSKSTREGQGAALSELTSPNSPSNAFAAIHSGESESAALSKASPESSVGNQLDVRTANSLESSEFKTAHLPKLTAESEVHFYSRKAAYGCFSSFSEHSINVAGAVWPTVEHFYQASKIVETHPDLAEAIRINPKPMFAARTGRREDLTRRADWLLVRDDVMRIGVASKMMEHGDVRETLLGTGEVRIVEASLRDGYWGFGKDGRGANRLGHILMEVRSLLQLDLKPNRGEESTNAAIRDLEPGVAYPLSRPVIPAAVGQYRPLEVGTGLALPRPIDSLRYLASLLPSGSSQPSSISLITTQWSNFPLLSAYQSLAARRVSALN